jgi:hypothetical protein
LSVRSEEETVLLARNGYSRMTWEKTSLRTSVTRLSHARNYSDERNPMTLPYRQERLARRADRVLRQSDPDLASMLSIFARLTAAEGMPAREQLRPQLHWAWRVLLWPAAAAAFLAVLAVGGGSRAAAACGTAARRGRPRSAHSKALTRGRE